MNGEVIRVPGGDRLVAACFESVLRPSFPDDELVDPADFADSVAAGETELYAILDAHGEPAAVATGDAFDEVMLLSYLAVGGTGRGGGLGGRLLDEVVRRWRRDRESALILAEVERPDRHAGSPAHGDPAARLRFYSRHGARALDLPYFQPPLRPGAHPVMGMLLLVLAASVSGRGPQTVPSGPLLSFFDDYLNDRPATVRLRQAAARPDGVRLVDCEDYESISGTVD